MPVLDSEINAADPHFIARCDEMRALADGVRELEAQVEAHSARRKDAFHSKGRLLPRERVAHLLDEGTSLLEFSRLAGYRMHDDDGGERITGGGCIAGIGFVSGRRCVVIANDSGIKGGAISPMGLKKTLRAQAIALENRLPVVNLVESAGANLLHQAELFVEGGGLFANMARLSARGIPQVTVVHGSSTAGGAYLPGLSDYVVVVRGRSKIFLAGPPLVKAAVGEETDDESLGGAEMHATTTGTAEYIADDDAAAIAVARELLEKLPWPAAEPQIGASSSKPPRYSADELLGVVPTNYRVRYDVRRVIARVVDDSDFLEFKAGYGAGTVCGHAKLGGRTCGLIGNNGPIFPEGAAKATHFIQACCQAGIPIVYLQNTTGFMVGTKAERSGIVKHGSKLIQAVANANVPQITILLGGSFGAGNYAMCGRAFDPRFIFAWPNAKLAVMGAKQAAQVMTTLEEDKQRRRGLEPDADALAEASATLEERLEGEADALFCTARLWDDGIIDPRRTREVLIECLAVCVDGDRRELNPSTFGVARI